MEQIGDYLVRRLIGEGGMGKVYEAEERLSKRRVALPRSSCRESSFARVSCRGSQSTPAESAA